MAKQISRTPAWKEHLREHPVLWSGIAACLIMVLFIWATSSGESSSPRRTQQTSAAIDHRIQDDLLEYVVTNLDSLEDYNYREVSDQIVQRLNQWIETVDTPGRSPLNPRLADLPADLRHPLASNSVESLRFQPYDATFLMQAIWLRDISNKLAEGGYDDLDLANRLFDWTVRNIELDPDDQNHPNSAWNTLLTGHGTAMDRAWVFVLLARQQGLDAVILGYGDDDDVQPWLPAVLIPQDNGPAQFYLFDPRLGVPIPGPDGKSVATLAEVQADDQVLRQLDLPDEKYPVSADQLKRITVFVEASPHFLARRMAALESHIGGEESLRLFINLDQLAAKYEKLDGVAEVRVWPWPYEALVNQTTISTEDQQRMMSELFSFEVAGLKPKPISREAMTDPEAQKELKKDVYEPVPWALWAARMMQFKGVHLGEEGSIRLMQLARPSDAEIEHTQTTLASEQRTAQQEIDKEQEILNRDDANELAKERLNSALLKQRQLLARTTDLEAMRDAKQHATFWLGLIAFERGDYETAANYFGERSLEKYPQGHWVEGARYNLARAQAALGQELLESGAEDEKQPGLDSLAAAIATLQATPADAPQHAGNLYLAREYQAQLDEVKPAETETPKEPPADKPAEKPEDKKLEDKKPDTTPKD